MFVQETRFFQTRATISGVWDAPDLRCIALTFCTCMLYKKKLESLSRPKGTRINTRRNLKRQKLTSVSLKSKESNAFIVEKGMKDQLGFDPTYHQVATAAGPIQLYILEPIWIRFVVDLRQVKEKLKLLPKCRWLHHKQIARIEVFPSLKIIAKS